MRPYILLFVIGVVVAGLAAIAVRSTVSHDDAATPSAQTARVLVALENISAGTFVQSDKHIGWGEWPADKATSPPYITEQTAALESFNGSVARRAVFAGEPITQGALVKSGEGGFLSAVLQEGKRAISISVNATTGNAGFIFPGDRVDLILTHTVQNTTTQNFASETFVRNVRVLAADQMLDNPENKAVLAKTITLEVTPAQAEAINVATEMGKISVSLRSLAIDVKKDKAPKEDSAIVQKSDKKSVGVDYFYPEAAPSSEVERSYTRDSDISDLVGAGGASPTAHVRIIHGNQINEQEFQRSIP